MSTQSNARYLLETPPYCPTVECYQHGNGQEHHIEGCPLYDTIGQAFHRLSHAFDDAAKNIAPFADVIRRELRRTWRGRLQLLYWDARWHLGNIRARMVRKRLF